MSVPTAEALERALERERGRCPGRAAGARRRSTVCVVGSWIAPRTPSGSGAPWLAGGSSSSGGSVELSDDARRSRSTARACRACGAAAQRRTPRCRRAAAASRTRGCRATIAANADEEPPLVAELVGDEGGERQDQQLVSAAGRRRRWTVGLQNTHERRDADEQEDDADEDRGQAARAARAEQAGHARPGSGRRGRRGR